MDNKKILIVDDVLQVRHSLHQYLSESGYTIFEAGSGALGLKCYKQQIPDLMILDFDLRDMNCFSFLGGIRKNEMANSNNNKIKITPALIISGGIKESEVLPFKDHLGIMGFMSKPLILPQLLIMVSDILGKQYHIVDGDQKILVS
ncbi:MAG: response regulator [candidate division Zixibacteria bacterium]|nr:response regulator [candidate division Zixibacteria bacterium]